MPDLFDIAAEAAAFASGRPLSQERTELVVGRGSIDTLPLFAQGAEGKAPAGFSCICGTTLRRADLRRPCPGCGR